MKGVVLTRVAGRFLGLWRYTIGFDSKKGAASM